MMVNTFYIILQAYIHLQYITVKIMTLVLTNNCDNLCMIASIIRLRSISKLIDMHTIVNFKNK